MSTLAHMTTDHAPSERSAPFRWLVAGATALSSSFICATVALLASYVNRQSFLSPAIRGDARAVAAFAFALLAVLSVTLVYHLIRLAAAIKARDLISTTSSGGSPSQISSTNARNYRKYVLVGSIAGGALQLITWLLILRPISGMLAVASTAVITTAALSGGGVLTSRVASRRGATHRSRPAKEPSPRQPATRDLLLVVLGAVMIAAGLNLRGNFPGGPYGAGLTIALGLPVLACGMIIASSWLVGSVARYVAGHAIAPAWQRAARTIVTKPRDHV